MSYLVHFHIKFIFKKLLFKFAFQFILMKKTSIIKNRVQQTALDLIINPATPQDAMFQHSVLCQTFLPYRNPGDDITSWEQKQGNVTLAIQALKQFDENNELKIVGLPYGTKARLILAHINSQAIKTQNPHIRVEDTLTQFIRALGLSTDGRTINDTRDQIRRITTSVISLGYMDDSTKYQIDLKILKGFDFTSDGKFSWSSELMLTEDYFNSLMNHAIPLDERALAALSNNAMALDIYAWLAQRLHRIDPSKPQFVSWQNLKDQFGRNYDTMKSFKQVFRRTLQVVRYQYQAAKIDEDLNKGYILKNSPTPIPVKTNLLIK